MIHPQTLSRSAAALAAPAALLLGGLTARAEQLAPLLADVTHLNAVSAITYYTEEQDGLRVVTTLQKDGSDEPTPVRFIATLQPGQKAIVSVPAARGEPAWTLEFSREGDHIVIRHAKRPVSLANDPE